MRFSLRLIVLTLLVAALVAPAAQAVDINFTFTDMFTTLDTGSGEVDEGTDTWFLELNTASTVSSVNVFGARPRSATNNDAAVGSYRTFTQRTTYTKSYYSGKVSSGEDIFLRCKKDNSSTYGGPLNASGTFIP